jgi:hypothetical protein
LDMSDSYRLNSPKKVLSSVLPNSLNLSDEIVLRLDRKIRYETKIQKPRIQKSWKWTGSLSRRTGACALGGRGFEYYSIRYSYMAISKAIS